jgi:hypothetical protein
MTVPEFVEDEFADFYRAMFDRQTNAENERAVFLEYAWDMGWCDPCAADPLSAGELRQLGVFWLGKHGVESTRTIQPQAQNVFVTRLHVRYDAEHFPEDLMFQETGDRQNYQGRYVIQHPWKGEASCDISQYEASVRDRQEREAQQLANLTNSVRRWRHAGTRERALVEAALELAHCNSGRLRPPACHSREFWLSYSLSSEPESLSLALIVVPIPMPTAMPMAIPAPTLPMATPNATPTPMPMAIPAPMCWFMKTSYAICAFQAAMTSVSFSAVMPAFGFARRSSGNVSHQVNRSLAVSRSGLF